MHNRAHAYVSDLLLLTVAQRDFVSLFPRGCGARCCCGGCGGACVRIREQRRRRRRLTRVLLPSRRRRMLCRCTHMRPIQTFAHFAPTN